MSKAPKSTNFQHTLTATRTGTSSIDKLHGKKLHNCILTTKSSLFHSNNKTTSVQIFRRHLCLQRSFLVSNKVR